MRKLNRATATGAAAPVAAHPLTGKLRRQDMPKFIIKAEEVVTYRYDVEADTIEEAIALVEDGEAEDCVETDSTAPRAVAYAIEDEDPDGRGDWLMHKRQDEEMDHD